MELEGKIIMDLPLQSGMSKAGNPWKKKEWVLETMGQYPRKVKFHVFGDRADTMQFEVGQSYSVSIDIESREFNGRWYTDVSAYAMRPLEATYPGASQSTQQTTAMPPFGTTDVAQPTFTAPAVDESDDLPF